MSERVGVLAFRWCCWRFHVWPLCCAASTGTTYTGGSGWAAACPPSYRAYAVTVLLDLTHKPGGPEGAETR